MYTTKITALLAALAATSSASTFYLTDFSATDYLLEPQSHAVSFSVSPVDTSEQHVLAPAQCKVSWNTTAPTCLTRCGDSAYYAQVSKYEGAYGFELDIRQMNGRRVAQDGVLQVDEGKDDDYLCSRGAQSTICSYTTEDSSVDVKAKKSKGAVSKSVCK